MELASRTLDSLDWPVVVDALAAQARTLRGARACRALAPIADLATLRSAHDAIDEVDHIEEVEGDRIPVGGVGDLGPLLARVRRGEVLDDDGLKEAGRTLSALVELAEALQDRADDAPTLAALAAGIAVDPDLCHELAHAYDDTGRLSASAWPELGTLRQAISDLHTSLRRTLDELLRSDDLTDVLQERYVTQRGDRYVLPIKAHAKRWDIGLVHGTSGSGQTVYIEPHRVVELNNRLRVAEGALAAEEHRIRAHLSRWLGRRAAPLDDSLLAAAWIDVACARHGLARSLSMTRPAVGREGVVRLVGARHPVLELRGVDVVPNDLSLTPAAPALVLTGPNTGGKTVALKTIGLCALLVRIGCFVPADEGSRVDLYDEVLADIGDSQTVEGDLSSFSGQVANLGEMLAHASPGRLLLLDELFTGTDPAQGAALARAFLEAVLERGPSVVVTTHYAQLKGLGASDPRFRLAAVEYAEGEPTYRVIDGATGESHAFEIARRIGFDPAVIERARALMSQAELQLHEALTALDTQRRQAEDRMRDAERRRADLDARERELAAREARIKERARALEEQAAARFLSRLERAEKVLGEVVADLQRAPSHDKVRAARATLDALAQMAPNSEPDAPEAPPALAVGDRVRLRRHGQSGEVVAVGDGDVQVRVGAMTLRVRPTELERIGGPDAPAPRPSRKKKKRREGASSASGALHEALRMPGNTLDLRGMRVDEGLDEVERFLDRAVMEGRDIVFVLHGHGTGAMKQAVRRWLSECRYVSAHAPANADQGGDAYTVVSLR